MFSTTIDIYKTLEMVTKDSQTLHLGEFLLFFGGTRV
jgi:hypothetical protein